jgi:exodeoxyribonuclease VII large subunit
MANPGKSQWDFGELFPVEAARKVLSVAELTTQVKRLLEKQVGQVWVTGEISNLRAQSSGHLYFTLKDAQSQLSCVLFRNEAAASREFLQDGCKVILRGDVTVYEPRGQYQLRVTDVELLGEGALQAAFEKLKRKLNAEGWFDHARKRPLPPCPARIGLVTSPTGAAIQDVLHVVQRRNPSLEIILVPCRVQGQGAAEEIASAIRLLNQFSESPENAASPLDLILVTRGGGSLEDLWAFNEEIVARAVHESRLPVVSAVGHEIDFTICDFVADFRAATPTAGAEIITEGVFSRLEFVSTAPELLCGLMRRHLDDKARDLDGILRRVQRAHPSRKLNESLQRIDDLRENLVRSVRLGVDVEINAFKNLCERLLRVRPRRLVAQQSESVSRHARLLGERARLRLRDKRMRLDTLQARLRLLGPQQVLERGYSITMRAQDGKIIRVPGEVAPGQKLRTKLASGEIQSVAS